MGVMLGSCTEPSAGMTCNTSDGHLLSHRMKKYAKKEPILWMCWIVEGKCAAYFVGNG